jgi:hypothetical protein
LKHIYLTLKYVLVHPLIKVRNQIVSARVGATIVVSCGVEASPRSVNYWTMNRGGGDIGKKLHADQVTLVKSFVILVIRTLF